MKRKDIISRLRNAINEVSDDSRFSNRYLWNTFSTSLQELVRRDADRGLIFRQANTWVPICVEMEPVSSNFCNCSYIPMNCTVYRSKYRLPNFIESSEGFIYRFISTPDLSRSFNLVSPFVYQTRSKIKFGRELYAFIHDGHLYTPDHSFPWLSISGLFTGDTSRFKCDNNSNETTGDCATAMEAEISLNDYLVRSCINMSLEELFRSKSIPKDEVSNNNTNELENSN